MIERVAIIGIGLIGGSLALAWKERLPSLHVTGFDKPDVLSQAIKLGVIDHGASSLVDAVRQADAVFLAVPLNALELVLGSIAPHLQRHTFVTDVGSVKQPVIKAAEHLLPNNICFIGGHPMTGSEQSGLGGADSFLFENAVYVLCPEGQEDSDTYRALTYLAESTGARVLSMDSVQHDRVVACVSHLPQLLATNLMNIAADRSQANPITLQLAAGGFRDMTRIASSPFEMWSAVLEANRTDVGTALDELIYALEFTRKQLRPDGNLQELRPVFERARAIRDTIPRDFKGFLRPLSDVFVYAKDQPGVLAHITGTLFKQGISIKDIELLKIREGTGGAFRISLEDDSTADAAVAALKSQGCRAHRLQ
ncbi:MAG: prephenate dehydrogenase [Bacteroidetes bacterium]|nr:prephenate dehydrogenase [Bacteroidota bacterium]